MAGVKLKTRVRDADMARLRQKLADIDRKLARKATRAGINEITKVVLADAKAGVPKRSGQLRKAMGRRIKSYRGETVVGIVGPRKGMAVSVGGVPVDASKYGHLVEFGRGVVRAGSRRKGKGRADTGKGVLSSYYTAVAPDVGMAFGPTVKAVGPRPFMRPAWDASKGKAAGLIAKHIRAALATIQPGRAIPGSATPPRDE